MCPSIDFKCPGVLQKIKVHNSLHAVLQGNFLAIFLRQLLSKRKHHLHLKNQGLSLILNFGFETFWHVMHIMLCWFLFTQLLFPWTLGRRQGFQWHRLCSKIYQSAWHQKLKKQQILPVLTMTTYLAALCNSSRYRYRGAISSFYTM